MSGRTADASGTRLSRGENYMQNVGRWPRRPRKTYRSPACGSRFRLLLDLQRQPVHAARMSVWPVAIQTRTPVGIGIIAATTP